MIDVAVARAIASPTLPYSRHFEAPRWWPEWIAQVLAAPARPRIVPAAPRAPATAPADARAAAMAQAAHSARAAGIEAAYGAAAGALRGALRDAQEAVAGADDWAITTAQHQVYLARRAVRTLLETATAPGPGSRLEWCLCDEDAAAG
jgi:hypothetical protein